MDECFSSIELAYWVLGSVFAGLITMGVVCLAMFWALLQGRR